VHILHLTGWPIPETLGGTEVYVESLCRALEAEGVRCVVGFPDWQRPWDAGDPRKAGRMLGWRPEVSLEEGLRRTREWIARHPESL
jgi:nucleoside-diphosphate-sugar epimerase